MPAQAVIEHRALGQIETVLETQFSNKHWQKEGTEKDKEDSFKIPDTFLKILSQQQTSGWVQLGQVGSGWSPAYLFIVRSSRRGSIGI